MGRYRGLPEQAFCMVAGAVPIAVAVGMLERVMRHLHRTFARLEGTGMELVYKLVALRIVADCKHLHSLPNFTTHQNKKGKWGKYGKRRRAPPY